MDRDKYVTTRKFIAILGDQPVQFGKKKPKKKKVFNQSHNLKIKDNYCAHPNAWN